MPPRTRSNSTRTDRPLPVLLTVAEAAERLRMSKDAVRQLICRGQLRAIRMGGPRRIRIQHEAILEFIEGSGERPAVAAAR